MEFYESTSTDPYYNLALEDYFFTHMDPMKDYFLLWQNDKAVIVGKYQNTLEEVDQTFVDERGIRVARRLSGGGAVYHDLGNLNYTFIVEEDRAEAFRFEVFTKPLLAALKELGVAAETSGRNDITIDGKKISGSSQYFRNGRLLHHGCILLDCDRDTLTRALQVKEGKIRSKSIKSVRSRVTSINEHLERPITMARFKEVLRKQVFAAAPHPVVLSQGDLSEIQILRDSRYATWEWNYGASPRCDIRREGYYPFGQISAELAMEKGRIQCLILSGDFFGREELSSLEDLFRGRRLIPEDLSPLTGVDLGAYVSGLDWDTLIQLLCG